MTEEKEIDYEEILKKHRDTQRMILDELYKERLPTRQMVEAFMVGASLVPFYERACHIQIDGCFHMLVEAKGHLDKDQGYFYKAKLELVADKMRQWRTYVKDGKRLDAIVAKYEGTVQEELGWLERSAPEGFFDL